MYVLRHDQLYNFCAHTGQWMAPHITGPGTVSMLHPLLCFFYYYLRQCSIYCLWNIKMTMTGTIRETKQKVTYSSAHQ